VPDFLSHPPLTQLRALPTDVVECRHSTEVFASQGQAEENLESPCTVGREKGPRWPPVVYAIASLLEARKPYTK